MANQANIKAVITADDKASNTVRNFGDNVQKSNRGIVKAAKASAVAIAAAGTAAVAFGVSAVKSYTESQNVMAQTNAVLKSTKGVAGVTAKEVSNLASSLQNVTRFSDETIQSGENLLLTFTKIGDDIFPQATETMLNMSQALGQDVKNSAIQLGKALQDPVLGITALRRVGVNFSDAQKEVIKNLVDTGKSAEAQRMILKELSVEFGGSARAAAQTYAGQLDILKNRFDDFKESIGQTILETLVPFAMTMTNLAMSVNTSSSSVNRLKTALQSLGNYISTALSQAWATIRGGLQSLQPLFAFVASQINSQLLPALRNLWRQLSPLLTPAARILGSVLGGVLVAAIGTLSLAILGASRALAGIANALANVIAFGRRLAGSLGSLAASIRGNIISPINSAIGAIRSFNSWFNRLPGVVRAAMSGIANSILSPFVSAFNGIVAAWNATAGRINFTAPDWVPGMGGKSWGMPKFASGTDYAPGGMVRVGEAGAENVILPKGSRVETAQRSGKGVGGGDIHFHIHAGAYMGSKQDARKYAVEIMKAWNDAQRMKGATV